MQGFLPWFYVSGTGSTLVLAKPILVGVPTQCIDTWYAYTYHTHATWAMVHGPCLLPDKPLDQYIGPNMYRSKWNIEPWVMHHISCARLTYHIWAIILTWVWSTLALFISSRIVKKAILFLSWGNSMNPWTTEIKSMSSLELRLNNKWKFFYII